MRKDLGNLLRQDARVDARFTTMFDLYALHDGFPGWEEAFDWSLLLERESFFALCASAFALLAFLLLRIFLGWYADHRLKFSRFRLRSQFMRAGSTFFHVPEIK